ncbi:MAG: DUF1501 domain-containing protein, partial [Gemmatimonadetes bacterium]|nr:DUF1501 domain-containing protein [Gemmatimonadota bacterium]
MSAIDHENCSGCREYNELSRRQFIAGTAAAAAAGATVFAPIFPAWLPRVVLAESADSTRDVIVSIFLRGGSDGLTLCVPFFDANYYAGRSTIAIPRPDSTAANRGIALDNNFAFPQALSALVPAFQAGHLLIVHATGSIDPSRSHFDAQRFMEVGKPRDSSIVTGWLGRHLASTAPVRTDAPLRALGLSSGLPKTLVGAPRTLPIPDPASFAIGGAVATRVERATWLRADYMPSPEPVRSASLDALNTIELLRIIDFNGYRPANGAVYPNTSYGRGLRSAAALIKADIGVEAVQVDLGGWDTHSNQGPLVGSMFNTMQNLAGSLAAFHADVIASGFAQNVTVVVLSEFGRNVRE